jgi:hypothetical protein
MGDKLVLLVLVYLLGLRSNRQLHRLRCLLGFRFNRPIRPITSFRSIDGDGWQGRHPSIYYDLRSGRPIKPIRLSAQGCQSNRFNRT